MKNSILSFLMTAVIVLPFITGSSYRQTGPPAPEGYAIVVAVPLVDNNILHNKFGLADTLSFDPVPNAVSDASMVEMMLRREGFKKENIIRLGESIYDKVSIEKLLSAFKSIAQKIKQRGTANDLFVFYYAGHGYHVDDKSGDEKWDQQDEVLVMNNGYLQDDDINALYKNNFNACRNVMICDACHSGSLNKIMLKKLQYFSVGATDPPCNLRNETNVDESINMIYFGSAFDGKESFDNGGGYFTRAMYLLHQRTAFWKNASPKDLACNISVLMQKNKDPGAGKIQYAQCGKLDVAFTIDHLFKIK